MNKYRVARGDATGAIWIDGRLRQVGDIVEMTEEQAKYLLLNGAIDFHPLDRDRDGKPGGSRRRARKAEAPPKPESPNDVGGD